MHPYHKIVRLNQRIKAAVGKLGTAPCGHVGEHVTPAFVTCLDGCDDVAGEGDESSGVPEPIVAERTKPICAWAKGPMPDCDGTGDVVMWGPEFQDMNGNDMWTCRKCHREFMG